ncbi:peptidoglycan D,D-transpeptidase FtsI family protein [Cellulosilyticum sp. I15G10I2]|uniref:peptidoglycan D,D-transpeptidase FtsI family protein n=1 Tax=Cellulosilyticum sp. I15G10I2 TaxID=1892843 RepID=UPI0009F7220E|nr:penicillin-binding transpeptidase domain-containing protein [Cellulosilyticum sp. I15G10I2]
MDKNKKFIYGITCIYISLFAVLIFYVVYFTAIKQKQISVHPNNTRLNNLEQEVIRGNIYDTNMKLLATTTDEKRVYPKGSLYAHVVGYAQRGKTGVEALANTELLYPDYNIVSLFKNAFLNEKFEGRDIVLTLDDRYQEAVAQAMKGKKGGVIVIEPTTGKIKAMYANPGFNPNNINEDWETLSKDTKNSPLINRATNGLYPPGSTFKMITALAYLNQANASDLDFTYECTGKITGDDYTIQCYNKTAHGHVDLKSAFYKSCNAYFIKLGEEVGVKNLKSLAEELGFNNGLHFDMGYAKSRIQLTESDTPFEKAATYIGQGKTLTTPFHMAILAAAIANDGVMMKSYVLDYSMNKKGNIKIKYMPKYEQAIIDEKAAKSLQDMMIEVVSNGTGVKLKKKNMIIGGKTGTAQNETAEDHSWFVGFAKHNTSDHNQIAFAVIVENGGKGAQALDVTQSILNVYEGIKP